MKFKVPAKCSECSSIWQTYYNTYICHMAAILPKNPELNVSTIEVKPDERPCWCPICKINEEIENLDERKKKAAEMIINGLSYLMGTENSIDNS